MRMKAALLGGILVSASWISPTEVASKDIHLRLKYSGSAISTGHGITR